MEIKVNNFKTIEKPKKNTICCIKNKNFYGKYSFPLGKLHFSMEILIFYTKNCVFPKFSMVLKLFTLISIYRSSCSCAAQAEIHGLLKACCYDRSRIQAGGAGAPPPPLQWLLGRCRCGCRYGKWKLKWIILKP